MNIGVILGVIVALLVAGYIRQVIAAHESKRQPSPLQPGVKRLATAINTTSASLAAQLPAGSAPEPRHDSTLSADLVGRRIRTQLQVDPDVNLALATVVRDLDRTEDIDDIIGLLKELNYQRPQICAALIASGYTLPQSAKLLATRVKTASPEWWEILYPLTSGQIIDRCKQVMAAVGEAEEHDWNDDEGSDSYAARFIPLFLSAGCEPIATLNYFFDDTGLRADDIVQAWPTTNRPTAREFGQLFATADIDIDAEDVGAFYDRDVFSFEELFEFFNGAKVEATTVTSGLAETTCDEDDGVLLKCMLAAGFPAVETLEAIENDGYAGVIEAAVAADLPIGTIVDYINKHNPDPDDLDSEMTDKEIDIHQRVQILHAYLFPATTAVEPANPADPA